MKKISFHPSQLQIVYFVIYVALFGLIIYIPQLIDSPLHITKRLILEEEIGEGILLIILFLLNILILNLYRKEAARQKAVIEKINNDKKSVEEKLFDSFRYIGQVNVQIQQIKSIFSSSDRFPETRNDFKKTLYFFGDRVLGIVNAGWVLFRIIDNNNGRTIYEQLEKRPGIIIDYPHVSNRMIIDNQASPGLSTVISGPQNLKILVCCILPKDKINKDERSFIQAITNEITMIFIILNSVYYKESGMLVPDNR
jgi:uncharacterized membrane protein (DUF485 family)